MTDDSGRILPWSRGASWVVPDNSLGIQLVFDARQPSENLPANLKLHLAMNRAEFLIPDHLGGTSIRDIKGPFIFDLSLSVDPVRRIADLNRTATTPEGETITIEKVIATRHDVRVIWRLDKATQHHADPTSMPPEFGGHACCSLRLEVGGKSTALQRSIGPPTGGDDVIAASVVDEQDVWTISAWYFSTWMDNMAYPDLPGPVFHFTMPPPIR